MMALCLSLVSKAEADSSVNNLIGKINFYSCESKTYQDIQQILSVDSQDILSEALQSDQCQRITNIDFQTAAEYGPAFALDTYYKIKAKPKAASA